MSEATIRAAIADTMEAMSDIGIVHDYERWAADWDAFLALFKVEVGGVEQIRGWAIGYNGFDGRLTEMHATATTVGIIRRHRFVIRGYLGLDDSEETEKTAAAMAIDVATELEESAALWALSGRFFIEPASLLLEPRTFGGVLCHYAEIALTYEEVTS